METKLTPWKITWDYDAGLHGDYYTEWPTVSNGIAEYECDTQEDAEELVKTLTEHSQLLQQRDELMERLKASQEFIDRLKGSDCEIGYPEILSAKNKETIQKHQI